MSHKIVAEHVSKVFGENPDEALESIRAGKSKDDILSETGHTVGVNDVSFSVEEGEIFVVMGLSGSGKSTLVRILNRLNSASAGSIKIDGEDILAADDQTLRRMRLDKIAMVFQHFALFPHKSVCENVEYGLKIAGVKRGERRRRALAALENVGLDAWASKRPSALSGGMQQRVGLARGLAVDPEILLMDEPFSALDPLIRRSMQEELLELQRRLKKTIIFITHDLDEALTLGDRIAIMKDGRFVQVGTAEEIVSNPADDYVAAFTQDVDRARVFSIAKVMRPAESVDLGRDGVAEARAKMEKLDVDAIHVTENGKLVGIATYRKLGATDVAGLSDVMSTEVPTVSQDDHVNDVYQDCASGLPVAVVDTEAKLVGVVTPRDIFKLLSQDSSPSQSQTEPAAPRKAS